MWPPPWGLPPRAALLRGLKASLKPAVADIEALGPSELQALAITLGLEPREFPALMKKYAAFGGALADAANDIAPSAKGGRGRPPDRIRRRISERHELGNADVRAGDYREVTSVGEAFLLGLEQVVLEHGGDFTFDRKGTVRGTIIRAWGMLKPYMPTGVDRPNPRRIQKLLEEARSAHFAG
jgi:hypothetical protein